MITSKSFAKEVEQNLASHTCQVTVPNLPNPTPEDDVPQLPYLKHHTQYDSVGGKDNEESEDSFVVVDYTSCSESDKDSEYNHELEDDAQFAHALKQAKESSGGSRWNRHSSKVSRSRTNSKDRGYSQCDHRNQRFSFNNSSERSYPSHDNRNRDSSQYYSCDQG